MTNEPPTDLMRVVSRSHTALLTTFRRSGEPVTTPVSLAVQGGRAYFVTATDSGKARRLARNERVEVASPTPSDRSAPSLAGRARAVANPPMPGRGVLSPTGPLFWSWLLYRLGCHRMRLYSIDLG